MPKKNKDAGILGTGMAEKARVKLSGRTDHLEAMLRMMNGEAPAKKPAKKK